MQRLRAYGLSAASMAKADVATIEKLIYPVGFYRNKAKFIKGASERLVEELGGDIPRTVEGLCSLKGVGPKMAYICMSAAWDDPVGIGVDVHVHRIANRLRWVGTNTPEETRLALESFVPRDIWAEINILLVGFGQTVCLPRGPLCGECEARSRCPEGRRWEKDAVPAAAGAGVTSAKRVVDLEDGGGVLPFGSSGARGVTSASGSSGTEGSAVGGGARSPGVMRALEPATPPRSGGSRSRSGGSRGGSASPKRRTKLLTPVDMSPVAEAREIQRLSEARTTAAAAAATEVVAEGAHDSETGGVSTAAVACAEGGGQAGRVADADAQVAGSRMSARRSLRGRQALSQSDQIDNDSVPGSRGVQGK